MNRRSFFTTLLASACLLIGLTATAAEPQRLLLLGQGPDGHPAGTHEYMPGLAVLADCLESTRNLEVSIIRADEPWAEGPAILEKADGAVVFLSEGAKWLSADSPRLEAFRALAKRGGGLTVIHWGMGTKPPENIAAFVELFGGCHGGPDRRYKVVDTKLTVAAPAHVIASGIDDVDVHEEFYYQLKLPKAADRVRPVMQAVMEGRAETVAWAYDRADGGRSFGFSGLHFHDNWRHEAYRRLVTQGVLWTLRREIPARGVTVDVETAEVSGR